MHAAAGIHRHRADFVTAPDDARFVVPLYTVTEAAGYLRVPRRTVGYWATDQGPGRPPIVTTLADGGRNQPIVPFVGLAEAFVAQTFRRVHGLSMQYIRKALTHIQANLGLEYALASNKLYSDGAQILYDYAKKDEAAMLLVEVVSNNVVFTEVIRDYLKRIAYGADGWAARLILPTDREVAVVNPRRAYGQPLTIHGGARIVDLLDRFYGGEGWEEIAEDFGVPKDDVEEIVRAFYQATRKAA